MRTILRYKSKWHEVFRVKQRFDARYGTWLDGDFGIEDFIEVEQNSATSSATKRGRPSKSFSELSDRGKRRIIDHEIVDPKVDSIEKALLLIARRTAYHQKMLIWLKSLVTY